MPPTWKRAAISIFIAVHLSAVVVHNLPTGIVAAKVQGWTSYYLSPIGQWQYWGMFAPDPCQNTLTLVALMRDSHGDVMEYRFPSMTTASRWEGYRGGFRHSKFGCNVGEPQDRATREFAARHVARTVGLGESDFPIDLQLVYEVLPTAKPGEKGENLPAPVRSVIETYRFDTLKETQR